MPRLSTRRTFMQQTAAVGAAVWVGGSVRADDRAANSRVRYACIGVGGKGASDSADCARFGDVVAICDIDDTALDKAASREGFGKAAQYNDFRKMLEEMGDRIDAVTVSTPDHCHAPAAALAMKMGKACFVQKPLTHTIWEARRLAEIAREMHVPTMMGNQGTANNGLREAAQILKQKHLGDIHEVHVFTNRPVWPQGIGRPAETPNVPGSLNWDLWIGPAPMRPYHPIYHPFKWRGWRDFGTGALGDIGCHSFDRVFWALKLNYPISVQGSYANPPLDWQRQDIVETFPTGSRIVYEFPARDDMPPVKICWYDGGLMPDVPEEMEEGRKLSPEGGILFIGEKGKLLNGTQLLPYSLMKEVKRPEKILPRITMSHEMNWVHACKTGEKACADFDFSGPLTEMVLMGNLSLYYPGQKIRWDGQAMQAVNLPEANQYVKHLYREGWSL